MNVHTLGISLLSLSLMGFAWAQDTDKPAPAPKPAEAEKPAPAPPGPRVLFETSLGNFVLELNEKKAPITAKNFLSYVDEKFYDNTIFHRVIPTFVIQGGGFELKDGIGTQKKTKAPIKNEAANGLKNLRGTISMARTRAPHSATTQFFINLVDNEGLNPGGFSPDGYAVFGRVVEGMDVVDKIKAVPTVPTPPGKKLKVRDSLGELRVEPMQDVPAEDVVVKTARRVPAAAE